MIRLKTTTGYFGGCGSSSRRLATVALHGFHIRETIDRFFPGCDEDLDWSLLLERRSFLFFFLSVNALLCLLILRVVLGSLPITIFR